jgi:hypothetical protein
MSEEQDFNPQPDPPAAKEEDGADFNPQPDPPASPEPPYEQETELNPQPEPPG